jgi:hypothetical protein
VQLVSHFSVAKLKHNYIVFFLTIQQHKKILCTVLLSSESRHLILNFISTFRVQVLDGSLIIYVISLCTNTDVQCGKYDSVCCCLIYTAFLLSGAVVVVVGWGG